jgi:hypothetical protein
VAATARHGRFVVAILVPGQPFSWVFGCNELKKIEVAGGPPQTLCTSPTTVGTGAWSKDNVILFGGKPNGPLQRVSAAGGIPADVTVIDSKRGET